MKRLLFLAPLLLGNNAPGSLDVIVTGIASTKGSLIACLWKDKPGFPICQKSPGAVRLNAPGTYAVSVQHDADDDGKLKTNFIGMPKEGVGISNNPGGIPSFAKSLVRVSGDDVITVRLRYL
jgi:uncharacterized protein (DUF2141 family)